MRGALLLGLLATGCGAAAATDGAADAPPAAPDAGPALDGPAEDLDLTIADLVDLQGLMQPVGRSYRVANPLGHEAEALAAASSPTGAPFPVGSIVEIQPSEVMVKRRAGFDATTADWEFFGVTFAADGTTPTGFAVRGTEDTACFTCHAMLSSAKWGFICEHP